jgi:glutamate-ammonia-ligase adenylyltransferase
MIRIKTTQGTLARRGFVDAKAAERVIDHWADEHEPLLDVLAQSADPDHALANLDRLSDRVPDLLARLTAAPVLARQLIMVLGASSKLTQHLIAHPEHIDLLQNELGKVPAASLRRELLEATGADPESPAPKATDATGDGLRIAYRGALLRIAARDLCAPEPIEAVVDIATNSLTWPTRHLRLRSRSAVSNSVRTLRRPDWRWLDSASAAPRS